MTTGTGIADRYTQFADQQAASSSPSLEAWARYVAANADMRDLLATLPESKQQPNLVFAAARLHGAVPGETTSLYETLVGQWAAVRATILHRSTQTNEAARCAAMLLGLQNISGPVALLEIGSAAGLCLIPDLYSYIFTDARCGTVIHRLDPVAGPSRLSVPITVDKGIRPPSRMPQLVWRTGVDLNPLDPSNPDDVAWLEMLIWPEHQQRRVRLRSAARIAAGTPMRQHRGDLLADLEPLVHQAPKGATVVVAHSATLAYLNAGQREQTVDTISRLGARRISFEGRGVDPRVPPLCTPITPHTLFVAALDGVPYALADGHGNQLRPVH